MRWRARASPPRKRKHECGLDRALAQSDSRRRLHVASLVLILSKRRRLTTETLAESSKGALSDLAGVFAAMPDNALDGLIEEIVTAERIVVFGLGGQGLQMRGFAMRLFHMGRDVAVWVTCHAGAGRGRPLDRLCRTRRSPTAQTLLRCRKAARAGAGQRNAGGLPDTSRSSRHFRPDDGERSERQALRAADGLSLRDGTDDRLRTVILK